VISPDAATIPLHRRFSSASAIGQHPPNLLHVGPGYDLVQSKRPFPFGGLFGQNVAGMGFSELVFP
jgi:hypothetical protein